MAIFACACGREISVMDESRTQVRCPACGSVVTKQGTQRALAPERVTSSLLRAAPAAAGKTWNRRYIIFALAVLPLLVPLGKGGGDEHDFVKRIEQTLDDDSATDSQRERVQQAIESPNATLDNVIEALPQHRLEGAIVARKTWAHWGFAAASAAGYFAILLLVFPPGTTDPKHLLLTGLFTATIGILLLLAAQWVAASGIWLRGGGMIAILFLILKFIGFSYHAALDPSNGFLLSFVGFTLGVGFCEELTKLLPLIFHFRSKATLDWRGACLWGLASGIGFGVSEGITYSSDYYNGIDSGSIYVVRFVACVALHALWAASSGIALYKRQTTVQGQMTPLEMLPPLIAILAAPMVLHGLYDTLLKQRHELLAFGIAVASFGWFAYQIESMLQEDRTA